MDKIVYLSKPEIMHELRPRVSYGFHYLVVDGEGKYRIEWVAEAGDEPRGEGEYAALLPMGVTPDEEEELAQSMVDAHIWEYIEHAIATGEDVGALQYVQLRYPDEWRRELATLIEKEAEAFLVMMNECNPQDAIWGFEYAGNHEYYVRQPPFIIEWAAAE